MPLLTAYIFKYFRNSQRDYLDRCHTLNSHYNSQETDTIRLRHYIIETLLLIRH
jgi:hypothetical protein